MFYCGTDELAYGKRSSKRIGFVSHGKSDAASSVDINVVETSAIAGGRAQERDPLDYVPELGPIEDLDLPDILPDLPDGAQLQTKIAAKEEIGAADAFYSRSDLMAAIRAAGGAGKARLKKVSSSRRAVKESESLSSSALAENKSSSGGNDLMASLAKALEARRKAIAGMSNPRDYKTGGKEKGDDQGPRGDGNNSGDEDWK
ncbi:hypothetical protein TELCIR_05082 [Teladorsagia circumcincta]|uniref:WH2 domain-containing protein n=1 Tax=Teladorsagia circumcincta TaxID=45464 RepID=A0A2G9UTW2_TELCI|nr:hypothetical protein TELCIR_05082 [Teladorsagia circumcincta]